MDKEKTMEAAAGTATQQGDKRILKRIFKFLLWVAGIWAILLVILQISLSPAVLTRIVDKFAAEYIDGDLSFSKIKVSMFRHFPNVGISISDGQLTYPAERFDSLETKGAQGLLLYHGCGDHADTLASFRHLSVGVNAAALLSGKISIPHAILVQPRIFAHSYDSLNANWNIFRFEAEEDTTSAALPPISIGKVRLTGRPHIVYTDSEDTLFAMINVKRMAFDGKLDTRKASKNKISLTVDSMMVAGRLAADTVGFGLSKLHLHEHHDHLDLHAEAKALLATRAFGRINVPISVKGTAAFPKDSVPAIAMHGFKAEIASIPIGFDAELRRVSGKTSIDASFNVMDCKVEDMIDGFVRNFIPEAEKIRTDAAVSLQGTCKGQIGNGELPAIDVRLDIPESQIRHKDIRHSARLALNAGAATDTTGRINVDIGKASFRTYGLDLQATGGAIDILGEDPLLDLDGKLHASADSLASFLPKDYGMKADGNIAAFIKGKILMSQLNVYRFGQADITGELSSDKLILRSPKDTIDISIQGLHADIGPEVKTSVKNASHSVRLLALNGKLDKADISLKDAVTFKGTAIDISAKNSVKAFSDTSKIYPLGGHISAEELAMEDTDGLSVTLDNTSNRFQMMPKAGQPKIPVISLSSTNKRIYLREQTNRAILTDAEIKGTAALNTMERRLKRKEFMDSLARVYPDVPKDSLFAHLRSRRQGIEVPEWMKEEDFKAKDINFSLEGSLAKYFREWDIKGDLDVRTGIVMTPYMPLRNIIKGIDVSITNNEVRIDSIKVNSGNSEIAVRGSLSGLRRALLGRGIYNLDLDMTSGKVDADELIAAYNAGSSFDPSAEKDKMTGASDSEFLKMVVADSLEKEDIESLIVVPANLNADIRIAASDIKFSDLLINEFKADVVMKERCMQIAGSRAVTNMGTAEFEGFYATRTKKDIRTGFCFNLTDVTTEKVLAMMPAIDTIMPLLKSFKGLVDCEIAATASLDTCMNLVMPSINGVIRLGGENLIMSDNKVFSDLAKKLHFKNTRSGKIDKMTVEGVIKDNTLEVFPFVVELDRYTLALSGLQHLDLSYKYHVSIIQSPMVFKVGIDLYGPDYDKMKFKIGRPKYKNRNVPVFTAQIDQTKINLLESIRGIFEKGVDMAIRENERQEAILKHKEEIEYVNAADQKLEELTVEEQKQLEEAQKEPDSSLTAETADSTSITTVVKDTLNNEQSGIH